MPEKRRWKHVRQLVNDGAQLELNGGDYHFRIASLYEGENQVCMFMCGGMHFDATMDHLEELAARFCNEGIVTDEVNGTEYSVW